MKYMKHYGAKFEMFQSIIAKSNPVIVEVGAHYGEDSMRFVESFDNATVYCFEPDPRNVKIFKKHIKNDNVKLFEIALSDTTGECEFFQSYDNTQSNFVPDKYDWISLEDYEKDLLSNSGSSSLKKGYSKILTDSIKVKTQRFDVWHDENEIADIDLVWIDVQGAEREVIEGMGDKIQNIKFIWIEYGELAYEGALSRRETVSMLGDRNFDVVQRLSSTTPSGDLLFFNRAPKESQQ